MDTRKGTGFKGKPNKVWQLQEAKAMFSDVIRATEAEPQFITVRGEETAVILSIAEYRSLVRPKQSLYEFIRNSPLFGVELELPQRAPEEMREAGL